jgi:tRNA(Ile)-lysidine synthase
MNTTAFAASFRENFPDLVRFPVLVALSGGSDSVALLCLLVECRGELGCSPYAVHVQHHLRGAEGGADEAFCRDLCLRRGVPFEVRDLDPRPPAGTSPEAWWRRERYRLLEDARVARGCAAVATAHTADDQAETVLLKLLRGSGPGGVAGIRRRRGHVVRPLLDARRAALRAWLIAHDQTWREDASNSGTDRPRTWIRNEVLPVLDRGVPRAVEHLVAFASNLAADEAVLAGIARSAAQPAPGVPVRLAPVRALPPALRRRWLLGLAAELPLEEAPSRVQLALFDALLDRSEPRAVDLGRRWVVRRRRDLLHLSPPPLAGFVPVCAAVPSQLDLPGGFRACLGTGAGARLRASLAPGVANASLQWRPARAGERLAGRAVRRLLAAAGIPPEWREAWPVLEADGTIAWIPAVGVAPGWEGGADGAVIAELEEPWECCRRS